MARIINGNAVTNLCDYSFGDQASVVCGLPGGYMKLANKSNQEFLEKCEEKETLTLAIDNIRLYRRKIIADNKYDQEWVDKLLAENDLLELCSELPNKFIIFALHEDTPIDENIKLPDNVVRVNAVNAFYNNDRIVPFPYGLQRQMTRDDHRLVIAQDYVDRDAGKIKPSKLLYMNCAIGRNNGERQGLKERFGTCAYATVRSDPNNLYFTWDRYNEYLDEILAHKFMICPQGHGMDCHRNWESLYLRRVPVMRRCQYFERLMKGFPVLFVDGYHQVTEELLAKNDHLFQEAQEMDLTKLDLNQWFATASHFSTN